MKGRLLAWTRRSAAALALAALSLWALREASERGRPRLELALSQALGLPVHIGQVTLHLLPLELTARDVAVGMPSRLQSAHPRASAQPAQALQLARPAEPAEPAQFAAPAAFTGAPLQLAATARAITIRPHISSLLLLRPILARLDVVGLSGSFELPAPVPAPNKPAEQAADIDPTAWRLPLDVHAAAIDIQAFTVVTPNHVAGPLAALRLAQASIEVAPAALWRERLCTLRAKRVVPTWREGEHADLPENRAGNANYEVPAALARAKPRARWPQQPLAVEASLRITGPFDAPEGALLEHLEARGLGAHMLASGQADLFGQDANVAASVQLALDAVPLGILNEWTHAAEWTPSNVSAEATVGGTWRHAQAAVELGMTGPLRGPGLPLAQVALSARLTAERLELARAKLFVGRTEALSATGHLKRDAAGAFALHLLASELDVPAALGALDPAAEVPFALTLTGPLDLTGKLHAAPSARFAFTWSLQPAVLFDSAPNKTGAGRDVAAHLGRSRLKVAGEATLAGVLIEQGRLELGDDSLQFAGRYGFAELPVGPAGQQAARGAGEHTSKARATKSDAAAGTPGGQRTAKQGEPVGLAITLWSDSLPLEAFSPVAGLDYAGRLTLAASLKVPPSGRFVLDAHVEAEGLKIGDVAVGHATSAVLFDAHGLHFSDLVVHRGRGSLAGQAAFAFGGPKPTLATEVTVTNVEARELLASSPASQSFAEEFGGPLSGNLRFRGPLDALSGQGLLETPRLTAYGVPLGQAELALSGRDGEEAMAASLWADAADGSLTANVSVATDGRLSLRAVASDVPLPRGWHGVNADARLNVRLGLDGPAEALSGEMVADVGLLANAAPDGAAAQSGQSLPATGAGSNAGSAAQRATRLGLHLTARAERGHAHFDAAALGNSVQATGTLALYGSLAATLALRFDRLSLAHLAPLLPSLEQASRQVDLGATGTLRLNGPLASWENLDGTLHLQHIDGTLAGAAVRLEAPVTLPLTGGTVGVPRAAFQSRTLRAEVSGLLRPLAAHQQWRLRVAVDGHAAALAPFVPQLTAAKGHLRLALAVDGEFARPRLFGEAEWSGGAVRLALGEQLLDQIALKVLFTGRGLTLAVGRARVGRGSLSLTGEWAVGEGTWLDPRGALNVRGRFEQVPLYPMPDASLRISGGIDLTGSREALKLTGDLKVDAARYTAKLDFDRLLRKKRAPPIKAAFLPFARPVALAIKLRAPGDIIISSKVLEAELSGDLMLTGTTDRIGLIGNVAPVWARARYRDNVFNIPRASVDFVDEYRIAPVYSIEVKTRACQMDASVVVAGDTEGYQLTPSGRDDHGVVDPQDVLSCLHLGVRLSDFTGKTAGYSDALTGSFDALWTVSGLDDKVRRFLPIRVDELRLTSAWSSINQRTTPRIVIGRDLGHQVGLRYSRAISTDEVSDQSFSLDYRASPTKTLQAGWMSARDVGLGDFGLDLRLHWELP